MLRFAAILLQGVAVPPGVPPVAAVPAVAEQAPSAAALAAGIEIAKLQNPEDATLAGSDVAIRAVLHKTLAADPDVVAIDKAHPGFAAAGEEAIRSTTMAILKDRLPMLWNRLGAAFARRLSEPELRETLTFYRSPAGARLVRAAMSGIDVTTLIDRQVADPDRKVETDELATTLATSASSAIRSASADDRTALYRFVFTPLGLKIRALNPDLLRIAADWGNERSPADEKRIETAVGAALAPFLAEGGHDGNAAKGRAR